MDSKSSGDEYIPQDKGMEKVQRLDGSGYEEINHL